VSDSGISCPAALAPGGLSPSLNTGMDILFDVALACWSLSAASTHLGRGDAATATTTAIHATATYAFKEKGGRTPDVAPALCTGGYSVRGQYYNLLLARDAMARKTPCAFFTTFRLVLGHRRAPHLQDENLLYRAAVPWTMACCRMVPAWASRANLSTSPSC